VLLALFLFAFLPQAGAAAAPLPRPLEPLRFLVGDWPATGGGAPGEASGGFAFESRLQDRVLVRTNHADYPAAAGRPASRHEDLMILYASDAGAIRADYYDSEGHVIRYTGEVPAPNHLTLVSEASDHAPRFRLSYSLGEDGVLSGRFEVAPPGKPDAFAPYLSWTAKRSRSGSR